MCIKTKETCMIPILKWYTKNDYLGHIFIYLISFLVIAVYNLSKLFFKRMYFLMSSFHLKSFIKLFLTISELYLMVIKLTPLIAFTVGHNFNYENTLSVGTEFFANSHQKCDT